MKIAPDVERLMWIAAESGDPKAVADFESRFPHLRYELSKRIDMVRKLKASGKGVRPEGSIPRFMRPPKTALANGLRLKWSVAAIALSALAVGSFYGTRMLVAKPDPGPHSGVVYTDSLPKNTAPPLENPEPPPVQTPEPEEPRGLHPPDDEPESVPKWLLPHNVKFERIGIATAIKAIAMQCGLDVEMPADMPDDEVVVRYQDMTGIQMLEDMAPRFGFSVFDQGEGKVLIVPARDEDSPSQVTLPNQKTSSPRRAGG